PSVYLLFPLSLHSSASTLLRLCFLLYLHPPASTLFPYTTLFRSTTPVCLTHVRCIIVGHDKKCLDVLRSTFGVTYGICSQEYGVDRKSTRLNSSHVSISYAVFCLKKKRSNMSTQSTSNIELSKPT